MCSSDQCCEYFHFRKFDRRQWRLFSRVIDRCVNPVELDADMAGTVDISGDVVKLVYSKRQLQQRNGQQRHPRSTSAQD